MPIERLPYTPISYPILNYPAIPRPPVIPWAQIGANFAQQLEETAKNLSPAERERKATELAILGAQARNASVSAEYNQMVLDQAKNAAEAAKTQSGSLNDVTNGILNSDKADAAPQPKTTPANLSIGGNQVPSPLTDLNEPDSSLYSTYHDSGTTLGEPPISISQDYGQQSMQGVEEGAPMSMDLSPPDTVSTDASDEGQLTSFTQADNGG